MSTFWFVDWASYTHLTLCPPEMRRIPRACLCVFKGWALSGIGQVGGQMDVHAPCRSCWVPPVRAVMLPAQGRGHSAAQAWPAPPGPRGGGLLSACSPITMPQSWCVPWL